LTLPVSTHANSKVAELVPYGYNSRHERTTQDRTFSREKRVFEASQSYGGFCRRNVCIADAADTADSNLATFQLREQINTVKNEVDELGTRVGEEFSIIAHGMSVMSATTLPADFLQYSMADHRNFTQMMLAMHPLFM
jgi:hypothetical protein